MKWIHRFLLLSRFKQIASLVGATHFILVFSLLISHWLSRKPKPLRPIFVRTVVLETPPEWTEEEEEKKDQPLAPIEPKPPLPKKPPPQPKPPPKPALPKPKTITAQKPPPKSAAPKATIGQKSLPKAPSPKTELTLPSLVTIQSRKMDVAMEVSDPNYKELLVSYLQNELDLPEYGEVKAKIEIDRFGRLIDFQILEAKNKKNAEFLKNRLPELSFPCLNESQSFTIVFKNVEIR